MDFDVNKQNLTINFFHTKQTMNQEFFNDLEKARKQIVDVMKKYNITDIEISNMTIKDENMHIGTIFINNK